MLLLLRAKARKGLPRYVAAKDTALMRHAHMLRALSALRVVFYAVMFVDATLLLMLRAISCALRA